MKKKAKFSPAIKPQPVVVTPPVVQPLVLPQPARLVRPRVNLVGVAIGIGLFLLMIIVASAFMYIETRSQLQQLGTSTSSDKMTPTEMSEVLQRLGRLTILPSESPIMATIINAPFLATQSAFYANAINGDKIIVYPKAQKAYIYSPSRDIIVNSGPLVTDLSSPSPIPAP